MLLIIHFISNHDKQTTSYKDKDLKDTWLLNYEQVVIYKSKGPKSYSPPPTPPPPLLLRPSLTLFLHPTTTLTQHTYALSLALDLFLSLSAQLAYHTFKLSGQ